MKIFKNLFNFSIFLIFTLSFTVLNAYSDQEVDEVESVEASADVAESEDDEDVTDVGRVTVTGSRIKRIDIEGATPIQVITRADIDQAGYGTVYETVSNLTQNIGEVFGENYQAGFTPANQVVDLRDFGPGRTLVLVNGKRMADYPFPYNGVSSSFNWGSIPLAAVERIEVLTAGASSIYGSDAVAGVINVVLVEGVEQTTFRATAGRYLESSDGGGQEYGFELTTGGVLGNFTYTLAIEGRHLDPLLTTDRDEYDNFDDEKGNAKGEGFPWDAVRIRAGYNQQIYGYNLANWGPIVGYQWWSPDKFLDSTGANAGATCSTSTNIDGATDSYFPGRTSGSSLCFMLDGNPAASIFNERDNLSAFFAGAYTINESAEVYVKAMQFNTETIGTYWKSFYYPAAGYVSGDTTEWSMGYANYGPAGAGVPNPVTGGTMWVADAFHQKSYNPPTWDNSFEETSTTYDVGVRGVLANGWEYDVSHTMNDYDSESTQTLWLAQEMSDLYFNMGNNDALGNPCVKNALDLFLDGYWNADNFYGFVDPTDPHDVYLNAFYWGQPTCINWEWLLFNTVNGEPFNGEDYQGVNDEKASSYSDFTTASLVGEFGMLPGGPIGFAVVAEYQDMGYDTNPSQAVVDGLLWGVGFTQSGGSRDREALGVEFRMPVTSELTLNVSGRKDTYDDRVVDIDRTTYGASLEYRPNEDFLFRASWSESFRAPDMQRSFIERVEGFTSATDYYQCWLKTGGLTDCSGGANSEYPDGFRKINIAEIEQGNLALRDESGDSYSMGFVWEPVDRLTVSLDFYKIILKDIVSSSSIFDLTVDEAVCRAQEAGAPIDNAPTYDSAYCNDVYDQIVRDGKPTGVQPSDPDAIPGMVELYSQPLNIASQEYQGADYTLRYTLITDKAGDFGFSFRGSSQLALKSASEQGVSRTDYMDSSYVPRSRQVVTSSWSLGDWSASLSVSRIGHVNAIENTKLSPYFNTNATVYYEISDDMYIGLAANNIFDAFPDRDSAFGTSSANPFPVNARLYPITGPAVDLVFQARF